MSGTVKLSLVSVAAAALLLLFLISLQGMAAQPPVLAMPALPSLALSLMQPQWATAEVSASATASACASDVALVVDYSGSMSYDTRCFGCYEQIITYATGYYVEYPAGIRRPLPYPDWIGQPQEPITYNGHRILAQEAEFYAYSSSLGGEPHDYHRDVSTVTNTFWVMQRVANSRASGYNSEKGDRRGAFMMHGPHGQEVNGYATRAIAEANAPRLDYAFDIPSSGDWYVWIRAQCGAWPGSSTYTDGCIVHWGADETPIGSTTSSMASHTDYHNMFRSGYSFPWKWVRLGSVNFSTTGAHHINFWGGGAGFKLDKIVLTTNPDSTAVSSTDKAPQFIVSTTPNTWSSVRNQPGGTYQTYSDSGYYGGPPDSGDREHIAAIDPALAFDWSLNPCNPQYGAVYHGDWDGNGQVDPYETCDNRLDDLFDDLQPMRDTQEAYKAFVRQARARFDQLALVKYSASAQTIGELVCLLVPASEPDVLPAGYAGAWDVQQNDGDPAWDWCYDHHEPDGTPSDDVTHPSILWKLEQLRPDMSTNLAEAMKRAIEALSTNPGHYGRPDVAKAMLLLSDGVANTTPSGSDPCKSVDLWNENGAGAPGQDGLAGHPKDCVIYYADRAQAQGIHIYAVALSADADQVLLNEVASRTGGAYYYAPSSQNIQAVYETISHDLGGMCSTLNIHKAATAEVGVGEPYTSTIAVSSTGTMSVAMGVIQEMLPPGTVFITASGAFWPAQPMAGGVITWDVGALPQDGAPVSVTLVLSVAQPVGTLVTTATVSSERGLAAQVAVGPRLLLPGLSIEKTVTPALVGGGEPFTCIIALTNTGEVAAPAVHIEDALPPGTFFVEASGAFAPPHPQAGETLVWDIGDLPNDGVPLTLTLALTASMPVGEVTLTNVVTALVGTWPVASDQVSLTVAAPALVVDKEVTPTLVGGDQPFTYTIVVRNVGLVEAVSVRIYDRLPPGTFPVVVGSGGIVDGDTVVWDVGDLASGSEPLTVTLVLTAAAPLQTTQVTNTASVTCAQGVTASDDAALTVAAPALVVAKTVAPSVVGGGQPFTYTIAVRNVGDVAASPVYVYDTLPPGTFLVGTDGTREEDTVVWQIDSLPNDGIPFTVTLALTTTASAEPVRLTNTVTATCAQESSASSSVQVTVLPRWFLYLPVMFKNTGLMGK